MIDHCKPSPAHKLKDTFTILDVTKRNSANETDINIKAGHTRIDLINLRSRSSLFFEGFQISSHSRESK